MAAALSKVAGSAAELIARQKADAKRRAAAKTILLPNEVSGEYDAARLLFTTLGGKVRPITHDDLRDFRERVRAAGKKFKGGIDAQRVINLAQAADRQRANKEIFMALPVGSNAGRIRFATNASKGSDKTRHFVTVELMNYGAAIASPRKPDKMVDWLMRESPLKYDCDCGRHTFWFRYITTIGGFNAGREEHGYPKIRNPKLNGVACKHVLRVMTALLRDGTARSFVLKMIERGRVEGARRVIAMKQVDAKATVSDQAAAPHRVTMARTKLEAKVASKSPSKSGLSKTLPRGRADPVTALNALVKEQGITRADLERYLKQMKA